MPDPCFITVTGKNQGAIEGSCTLAGHEKAIMVHSVDHSVSMPHHPHTGQSTGKRQHQPLVITKEIDKSSPKLFQALIDGETLTDVELKYFRIKPGDSKEEHYFTQKLAGARVVSVAPFVPSTLDKDNASYGHMEKVGFTYDDFHVTWEPDGIAAADKWSA